MQKVIETHPTPGATLDPFWRMQNTEIHQVNKLLVGGRLSPIQININRVEVYFIIGLRRQITWKFACDSTLDMPSPLFFLSFCNDKWFSRRQSLKARKDPSKAWAAAWSVWMCDRRLRADGIFLCLTKPINGFLKAFTFVSWTCWGDSEKLWSFKRLESFFFSGSATTKS